MTWRRILFFMLVGCASPMTVAELREAPPTFGPGPSDGGEPGSDAANDASDPGPNDASDPGPNDPTEDV